MVKLLCLTAPPAKQAVPWAELLPMEATHCPVLEAEKEKKSTQAVSKNELKKIATDFPEEI